MFLERLESRSTLKKVGNIIFQKASGQGLFKENKKTKKPNNGWGMLLPFRLHWETQ